MNELRRALPFLAFALAMFVAGCSLLPAPARPTPEGSNTPVGAPAGDTTAIDAAMAAWNATAIDDYVLNLGFLCGCALAGNAEVTVEDGVPARIEVNGRDVTAADAAPFELTVEGLLAEARRAIEQGGSVVATFDPATGTPARLEIDYMPQAIDDELTIVVNGLTPATDQN